MKKARRRARSAEKERTAIAEELTEEKPENDTPTPTPTMKKKDDTGVNLRIRMRLTRTMRMIMMMMGMMKKRTSPSLDKCQVPLTAELKRKTKRKNQGKEMVMEMNKQREMNKQTLSAMMTTRRKRVEKKVFGKNRWQMKMKMERQGSQVVCDRSGLLKLKLKVDEVQYILDRQGC